MARGRAWHQGREMEWMSFSRFLTFGTRLTTTGPRPNFNAATDVGTLNTSIIQSRGGVPSVFILTFAGRQTKSDLSWVPSLLLSVKDLVR